VRLLGVGVTQVSARGAAQLGLFGEGERGATRRLNQALDALCERFGPEVVVRGGVSSPPRAGLSQRMKRGEADA
jgi:hypothetical protein